MHGPGANPLRLLQSPFDVGYIRVVEETKEAPLSAALRIVDRLFTRLI